ncbi:hypothetical protein [Luteimonas cucumeris]|uniref:hypothetical protein n=1 Tax=Luteimonas cucumeris TaxID=985012 RepID=UPI00131578BB
MERVAISQVEIDGDGRLHVVPTNHSLPYIYREGMEIQWDSGRASLHSPKPRVWSYAHWFQQILAAAREQGCHLELSSSTRWINIDAGLKNQLLQTGNEA